MRPVVVVSVFEVVQLFLEHPKRCRSGFLSEMKLQGLVEALDFALGLRVVWRGVFLHDSKIGKFVFKLVAATSKPGGEDPAVICQGRLWRVKFNN